MKTSNKQEIYSYKISSDLYLIRQVIPQKKQETKPIEVPTNYFTIIDCSGSMSYDLPKIREQLKKKLPKLLKEKDTITIIWFSGKNQFGTLLEAEPVSTLVDLNNVNQAIDRWLKPIGLTGFKEPLEEAARVVERVSKKYPGSASSLIFMSDGCDNQWSRSEIIKVTEEAAKGFSSSTFVEYGYYADRPLLTTMAEKSGGSFIFAEDFDRYAPTFEAIIQKKQTGAPRVELKLEGNPVEGLAFAASEGDLLTYSVNEGVIYIPEDLKEVSYLSSTPVTKEKELFIIAKEYATPNSEVSDDRQVISSAYAALSLFAVRMKSNIVFALLKALGDVKFIDQFSSCFGKQAYSVFQEETKEAAFTPTKRWSQGWDPEKIPADDAFTILDLLQLLSSDESNKVLLDNSAFKYNRIGRSRIDSNDVLSKEEQEEIQELTVKLASEKKVAKSKEISDRIAEITNKKSLKFESSPSLNGYPILSLTYNEDRPNISFLVRKLGKVDLTDFLPEEFKTKIPQILNTFTYRNYAVVKDGLVNIDQLPVRITKDTYKKLIGSVSSETYSSFTPIVMEGVVDLILNLRSLPVINRKMVKEVSAKSLFETKYQLLQIQAEHKVYSSFIKEVSPDVVKSESFALRYGEEATAWLKEKGITDYSGFSPKMVQAEAVDFYMGKELKVSLKGYSSLPSLKDVRQQIAKGKINAAASLMVPTVNAVEDFRSKIINKNSDEVLVSWLREQEKLTKAQTRDLIYEIAKTTFCVVLGQVWFSEFKSLDENTLELNLGGGKVSCKVDLRDIEIKI
jgi:hypothetical protein